MIIRTSASRGNFGILCFWVASAFCAACGSDSVLEPAPNKEPGPSGATCGGVEIDDQCYALCDDGVCNEGNSCVFTLERPQGYCTIACQSNDECPIGFACRGEVPTSGGQAGKFCIDLDLEKDGAPGVTCASDDGCDVGHGLRCFEDSCRYPCPSLLSECRDGMVCKRNPNAGVDGPKGFCVPPAEDPVTPGQYGTDCPFGDDQCNTQAGFKCVGPAGTPDAYCTKPNGCEADSDCPSGYWCGATRVIANEDVDFSQQPKTCLRRGFCDPCETDFECGHTTNAICVPDAKGEKFCSIQCAVGTDSCVIGAKCEDVGDGRTACRPDVGVCFMDDPKGCDPCRIDSDCGPNSTCNRGGSGYKPSMKWCSTPCGPADEHGKRTCPIAPNGLEMVCLDENNLALGGPLTSEDPGYLYNHCYSPIALDNTELFPDQDAPNGVCGNIKVEKGEECDDANDKANDGCDKCQVTPACTFTITEPNGDGNPLISPVPDQIKIPGPGLEPMLPHVIHTGICGTFKVVGALESAGDVDVVAILLPNGANMKVDTYTNTVGACTEDLTTEARVWKNGEKVSDENLLDLDVPCEKLSDSPEDYASTGKACPGSPTHLGCGTCTRPGVCGVCDKDSGIGNCTRMIVSTTTEFGGVPVYFEGRYKVLRVYANDPAATVGKFILTGSKFFADAPTTASTPPALSCY